MSPADIAVICAVAALVAVAVAVLIVRKKRGGCCGDCCRCKSSGCHPDRDGKGKKRG